MTWTTVMFYSFLGPPKSRHLKRRNDLPSPQIRHLKPQQVVNVGKKRDQQFHPFLEEWSYDVAKLDDL